MPGKKRSERQTEPTAVAVIEKPLKERPSATPAGEYRAALCPVCGRAAGMKRLQYPYNRDEGISATQNYWEWL